MPAWVAISLEGQIHHVQADAAVAGGAEGTGDGADDLEAQVLPEVHRSRVGLDDGVELDAVVALLAVPVDDVRREGAADATPARRRVDHERRRADVVAARRAVGAHLRGTEDPAV